MKGFVCSVLAMIFGMTVACKLQSNHAEEKWGSKAIRKAAQANDLTPALKNLIDKSNKTDDEWSELAEAIAKGGTKGDAVIRIFAERINKNRLTIDSLVNKLKPNKITGYEQLETIRKKIANEFNELANNLADNVSLMERAFLNRKLTFEKRAEIFAKLHPSGDNHSTALKAFNSLHDESEQIPRMFLSYEALAASQGVSSDAYRLFAYETGKGLSGKTLVERQIKALFSLSGETTPLAKIEDTIGEMKKYQNSAGQEDFQDATSRQFVSEIKRTFLKPIKSIGGKGGLTDCCGQHLVETLREASKATSRNIKPVVTEDLSLTYRKMASEVVDELENISFILQ